MVTAPNAWLAAIAWNEAGLVPVVTQDATSGEVLMLAWMSRESLSQTLQSGDMVYWSRSRNALWRKGETSGHFQRVVELRLDCDADALLAKVEQVGGIACHTGRRGCFFKLWDARMRDWVITEPVIALDQPGAFRE
ncbi:MAG: phosphoribosyl-AMP cyclohydrolase [Betaproteobacteria bacterium]|nr:phosphoribosyl-AMP cyclohydrolase [Betaproteobacteria bacterium]